MTEIVTIPVRDLYQVVVCAYCMCIGWREARWGVAAGITAGVKERACFCCGGAVAGQ